MRMVLTSSMLAVVGVLASSGVIMAQDPGGVVVEYQDDYGGAEAAPRSALDQANDFLAGKGWRLGYDRSKGIFIAIGSAAIKAPPGDLGFDLARQEAAVMSLMNAKAKLARFLSQEVETELLSRYSEPNIGETLSATEMPSEPGLVDKVILLANAELDGMLNERGINPKDPEGAREAAASAAQLVASETFSSAVSVMSRQEIGGVQAYRSFESVEPGTSSNQIAAVAVFSPKSKQLHDALLGSGDPPRGNPRDSISVWARSQGPEVMLYTHGVQPRTDENGEVSLVLFGQATPRTSSSRSAQAATDKARMAAVAAARRFLGEMVVIAENSSQASSYAEYADDSTLYSATDSFEQAIQSRSARLKMPGIAPVYTWKFQHPLSGKTTYGWVGKLSVSDALAANELRDIFNEVGGSQGGAGISGRRPAPPSRPKPATPAGGGRGSGAGAEGEGP